MDTYADAQEAEFEAEFGNEPVYKLEEYIPTKYVEVPTALEYIEEMAKHSRSTTDVAMLRYLHRLIMKIDPRPLPF